MKIKKKKLWIVKREVRANSIEEASKNKGTIYEITIADDRYQPDFEQKKIGFNDKK